MLQPMRWQQYWTANQVSDDVIFICGESAAYLWTLCLWNSISWSIFPSFLMTHELSVIQMTSFMKNSAPELEHNQSTSKQGKSFSLDPRLEFHIASWTEKISEFWVMKMSHTLNLVSVIAQIPQKSGWRIYKQQYGHPFRPMDSLIRPRAMQGQQSEVNPSFTLRSQQLPNL